MPFTETDLRELLAERSRDLPAGTDIVAVARQRGRRIRTRRRVIGAGLATCALMAVAFLPLGPAPSAPGPAVPPKRVDVSPFRGDQTSDIYVDTPAKLVDKSDAVVLGTYEGFASGGTITYQEDTEKPPRLALQPLVMRVRVDRKIKGADKYVRGGRVYISFCCGTGGAEDDLARHRSAIPPGTRLVAFLHRDTGIGGGPHAHREPGAEGHPPGTTLMEVHPQGLVFEDPPLRGPTRLVGGIVDLRQQGPAWNRAATLDAFAAQLSH